jgi:hypothetical protein
MYLTGWAVFRWSMIVGVVLTNSMTAASSAAQTSTGAEGPVADSVPIPRYEVRRTAGRINIDGLLDDEAWKAASAPAELRGLWEFQTGPQQATQVWLLWDDNYLYVGYEVEDVDITSLYLERDDPTYLDDAVEIFINPRPQQVSLYYGIELNARTVYYDYLLHDARLFIKLFNMEGIRAAAHLRGTLNVRGDVDEGWSLEVAIPWSNFTDMAPRPTVGTMWKAQLNRWDGVPPDRRMSIWSDPLQTRAQPHVPARFGELIFVE